MQNDGWTSADLEHFPENGHRYEIIDGDLFVSKQPHWHHQYTCTQVSTFLGVWSMQTGLGQTTQAPGLLFGEQDDVAPDVVWISLERRGTALGPDGKLHAAPELVVEVASPGSASQERDRKRKLALYSRRGVREYWIVDWRLRNVEVYRRKRKQLCLIETLHPRDTLKTPLLPGFACAVSDLFDRIPLGQPKAN